jgi:hypothetical protein
VNILVDFLTVWLYNSIYNKELTTTRANNMNYILNKFEAGEVISKGFVCGWEFDEGFDGNYEHRPLMQDAMDELLKAGYVTGRHVEATREARELNNSKNIAHYLEAQKSRSPESIAEERAEARAAMGPGESMVNIITGEQYTT